MMTQLLQPGSPNLLLTSLVGWLVLVNALAFLAFFLDHRRAMADQGAMPGGPLLLLATIGGWPGAQLGQVCFQGQYRERSFRVFLNVSILPVLALVGTMAAQDVDWSGLGQRLSGMLAPQATGPGEETPVQSSEPAKPDVTKPAVKSIAKTAATKQSSVTNNPDLPKRIGPGGKTSAWHAR